ncbi:MAG: alanine racemase, partial [Bdellovibrionales bacterium]|nr:alanine racemase [Bdellovibrionales bacterium]
TRVSGAGPRSRAVLLGADGRDRITAEELAKIAGTIPYEIVTGIQSRVPRVMVHG